MCGIVGYIGEKKATPVLINGLLRLEYRGYDSAGLAVIENNNIICKKEKGRVKNLESLEGISTLTSTLGIAHTRWATHGRPSNENSHPHLDNSSSFAVVHNGIIENYHELRKFLEEKGYHFISQTDTEVIPNLIHYYHENECNKNGLEKFMQAVILTSKDLKGSFALEIISRFYPDNMIVIRKDSPLVIGKGENECYISSDIPAILSFTRDFYLLNDLEFALLARDSVKFFDIEQKEIKKEVKNIEWAAASAEKDGFEDFMLKEIHEQPKSIRETIGAHIKPNEPCSFDDIGFTKEDLLKTNKIYIVACGTAMHAGLGSKYLLEKLCNIPVEVDVASEFRYRNPIINENTLCIYISQSGETADTIAALKLAKSKKAKTLAISNVIGSSITREADITIYTHAGPEIAVASTKAYTSQLTLLSCLAVYFGEILESYPKEKLEEIKKELLNLPEKVEKVLKCSNDVKDVAKKIYKEKDVFFIGRGIDYTASLEGSLKLKEISYIHSEAYAAGELKHGPIALIENGVTVVAVMTDEMLTPKTISNIQEVITRGAKTFIVTNQEIDEKSYDYIVDIPKTISELSLVLSIVPLQLLAYYISKEKGLDVDKPRNLAKSVTVE